MYRTHNRRNRTIQLFSFVLLLVLGVFPFVFASPTSASAINGKKETVTGPQAVATCNPTKQYRILIVYSDYGAPGNLRSALLAEANVSVVDYFNAINATPSLSTLQQYQIVVTYSNLQYADNVTLGNNLASYQDSGGIVVASYASFYNSSYMHAIKGRWLTGGYSPFNLGSSLSTNNVTVGWVNLVAPLVQGVNTLNAAYRINVTLAPGAVQVAIYSDYSIAVAYKLTNGSGAIGMPAYLGNYAGAASGDYAHAIVNAARWLIPQPCQPPTTTPTPWATPTNTTTPTPWGTPTNTTTPTPWTTPTVTNTATPTPWTTPTATNTATSTPWAIPTSTPTPWH